MHLRLRHRSRLFRKVRVHRGWIIQADLADLEVPEDRMVIMITTATTTVRVRTKPNKIEILQASAEIRLIQTVLGCAA